MIQQWCLGNGSICGRTYDIQTLSLSLGISPEDVRIYMRDEVLKSQIWDKDKQEDLLRGLIGTMISWTFEDRMKINNQINILTASQGNTYKPFVSAELNKALKMGLESSTSIQSLVGRLTGSGQSITNILFQQNNENNIQQNNYATREEVLEILSSEQVPKSEAATQLETQYDLASLPEVVATRQEGFDTSREGLEDKINSRQLQQITDNLKAANQVASEDHHSMRREIEMRIDEDQDDPELDQYEEDPNPTSSASDFLI